MLGKRVQGEEVPLQPKGLAPKRLRGLHTGQGGGKASSSRGKEVRDEGELSRGARARASGACQVQCESW